MRSPIPPRLATSLSDGPHDSLADVAPHDEWRELRVVGADLTGLSAEHLEVVGCELRAVRLTGADLEHLRLVDVRLVDCELSGALLHECTWVRVELHECPAGGLVLARSTLTDVTFSGCRLDDANLRFVRAERVRLEGCSLVDADLADARFDESALEDCDLRRIRCSGATMGGTRLAGSTVEGVQGARGLAGVRVTPEQVLPLALGVFADLGIVVEHPEAAEDLDDEVDPTDGPTGVG